MEEKKISEKESLELISQMIQQTQQRITTGAGMPFIAWGVIMMVVATVIGFGILFTGNGMWMWGYFAIPVLGCAYNYVIKRRAGKTEKPQMKTYIEENLQHVWKCISFILFVYPLVVLVLRTNEPKAWIGMYFLGVFMPTIGSFITGLMLKIRHFRFYINISLSMCLLLLSDLFINNVMTNRYNFLFALITFFSLVVPGIIINKEARKNSLNQDNNA